VTDTPNHHPELPDVLARALGDLANEIRNTNIAIDVAIAAVNAQIDRRFSELRRAIDRNHGALVADIAQLIADTARLNNRFDQVADALADHVREGHPS
jgi:hypothetical protein